MTRRPIAISAALAAAALTVGTAAFAFPGAAQAETDCDDLLNIAHRGNSGVTPENTHAAMASAALTDAPLFEIDVQMSSDGVPVLLHDATLKRTTDVEEVFPDRKDDRSVTFTFDELEKLDAGSWYDESFAGENIPPFKDVLDHVDRDGIGVVIELKSPDQNPGLMTAIDEVMDSDPRWAELVERGLVMITSFDADELQLAAELQPDVPLVWVQSAPISDAELEQAAEWADYFGTNYRKADASDVDRAHAAGLKQALYTPDSPEALQYAMDVGADAVWTDYPEVLSAMCAGEEVFPHANGVEILDVVADVPGADLQPETGEHVVLTNTSDAPIDVSGYYLHDAVANRLVVGDGYVIPPGGELRVYTGPGTNSDDRYYNDFGRNVLNNTGDSLGVFAPGHVLLDVYGY